MNLPSIHDVKLQGKRVLLRLDTDVPIEKGKIIDGFRLAAALPTIELLLENNSKVVLIGHRGRPHAQNKKQFSLQPIAKELSRLLKRKISIFDNLSPAITSGESLMMVENLRYWEGEEKNDTEFTKKLAQLGEIYINESFADCHREHASIVGLPKLLPHAAGPRLIDEVIHLEQVLHNPKEPVVIILGGGKIEKAQYVNLLLNRADWVLVGGLLARVVRSFCRANDGRSCIAAGHLVPSGEDIDEASAVNFSNIIKASGTVVWNGPMGKYEEVEFMRGTQIIAEAISQSSAYKIVGGADTIAALKKLGVLSKMDWVSTGGGAMLQFLAEGDLPGLQALRE